MNYTAAQWTQWVAAAAEEVQGFTIDSVYVPSRTGVSGGFPKGEWVFRLTARGRAPRALWVSLRPQHAALALVEGKGPAKAAQATFPPFLLKIRKELSGKQIQSLEVVPGERFVVLTTSESSLVWVMIPARPDAYWVDSKGVVKIQWHPGEGSKAVWPVLRGENSPQANQGLAGMNVWEEGSTTVSKLVEKSVTQGKASRDKIEDKRTRKTSQAVEGVDRAMAATEAAPPWAKWGTLLQGLRAEGAHAEGAMWKGIDPVTQKPFEIPVRYSDLSKEIEHCFAEAKKLQRKRAELLKRRSLLLKEKPPADAASLTVPVRKPSPVTTGAGLEFASIEGARILVGRSVKENREITMRIAKGNDFWLHVKGRPGSHVVVIPPSKAKGATVSQETLLDAAVLCVLFSKGQHWGRTEVDCTRRKFVKVLSGDGFNVTYTQNKTWIVDVASDEGQKRIRRLVQKP